MNTLLIFALICIGCFLLYWLLNFLSTKAYRSGLEILGAICEWGSIVSLIISVILLISIVVAVARLTW